MISFITVLLCTALVAADSEIDWSQVKANWAFQTPLIDAQPTGPRSSITGRITNGFTVTDISRFNYQVGIFSNKGGSSMGSWCGGSLISNQWVLTAAHCVEGQDASKIFLGTIDKSRAPTASAPQIQVTKSSYVEHREYNSNTLKHDIALIRLPQPIQLSNNINTVALDRDTSTTRRDNQAAIVSGWGATVDGGATINMLQFAPVKVMPNQECARTFGSVITPTQICQSVTNNQGICQGDSGGPMVAMENGKPVLIGVTSFTARNGCNTPLPRVFTRVSQYTKWICDNTNRAVC